MEMSLLELWKATGPVARGVVALLGVMSVGGGAVATEKWRRVRAAEQASDAFLAAWRADPDGVTDAAAVAGRFPTSPVAGVVAAAAEVARHGHRAEVHDRTVRRHVLATSSELRRGLSAIATIGSTAPFIGLFGTVIGIVNAFHEIGTTGHGGIATVSTGIAEALITTAFGIMVAIPAVWLFNHLTQRIGRLLVAVECAGEELAVRALQADAAAATPTGERGRTPSWR